MDGPSPGGVPGQMRGGLRTDRTAYKSAEQTQGLFLELSTKSTKQDRAGHRITAFQIRT